MQKADLLAFPPTRIHRRPRRMKNRKHIVPKKSPALIVWAGLIMLVRCSVPPALYVLAGAGLNHYLGW